jgi:hypothetical protein
VKLYPSFLKQMLNNECGKVIYMGNVKGPDKVNDICMKTMHAEMMDKGFTVFGSSKCIFYHRFWKDFLVSVLMSMQIIIIPLHCQLRVFTSVYCIIAAFHSNHF